MNRLRLLVCIILGAVVSSCSKEDDPLVISVSPLGSIIKTNAGDIIGFEANCKGTTRLKSFRITIKEQNKYSKTLFDTTLEVKSFSYHYEYKIPEYSDSITENDIFFSVIDEDGNEEKAAKIIYVSSTAHAALEEYSGLVLYSGKSGKENACNINSVRTMRSADSDSSTIDLVDCSDGNTLSRKWMSQSGLKFVKFNSLDYANASSLSLENAYESGIKTAFVDNLQEEDIIITKYTGGSSSGYAAVKVSLIVDQDSCLTDRYIFSIKK